MVVIVGIADIATVIGDKQNMQGDAAAIDFTEIQQTALFQLLAQRYGKFSAKGGKGFGIIGIGGFNPKFGTLSKVDIFILLILLFL